MTNEEKYKTHKERINAFRKFCKENDCMNCPINVASEMLHECAFGWLALEAEEEKPMPCPFCGEHTHTGHSWYDDYSVWCDHCGYKSTVCKSKDEAIAAHNRVCRAVKAYKESEVAK